jgi:hypothetical protein
MTFTLSRPLFALAALITSATLITGVSTQAFAAGAPSRLVAANPAKASGKIVIRDALWSCNGGVCVAPVVGSRPEIACAEAARKLGKIDVFSSNGQEFSAEQLAQCNTKAK